MATEVERKFLLTSDAWRAVADSGTLFEQGYIATANSGDTVRVRIAGETGYLTLKGPTKGLSRAEWEYEIPVSDAQDMLQTLCKPNHIRKKRHLIEAPDGLVWEIDVFEGKNAGLIIAEVELDSEAQEIELPNWIGAEVSDDPRYFNASLVEHPFSDW